MVNFSIGSVRLGNGMATGEVLPNPFSVYPKLPFLFLLICFVDRHDVVTLTCSIQRVKISSGSLSSEKSWEMIVFPEILCLPNVS